MFELDEVTHLFSQKAEIDAMAAEFAENAPTCVCRGCETHGCKTDNVCREDTQPGVVLATLDPDELGAGSNEDEWEVVTSQELNPLFADDLDYQGGEG